MGMLSIPKTITLLVGLVGSFVTSSMMVQQPAHAGRYVINQPVEMLNSYFNEPTKPGAPSMDGEVERLVHGYDSTELDQLLFNRTWENSAFNVHFVSINPKRSFLKRTTTLGLHFQNESSKSKCQNRRPNKQKPNESSTPSTKNRIF